MLTICLASVPPRFDALGPVLESLLAQRPRPDRIILSWCPRYARFPGHHTAPSVPDGVDLFETQDIGPLTKLAPLPHLSGRVAWCDDDCRYGPGWLAALAGDGVSAGSSFSVRRLRRDSDDRVVQGFAGVAAPVTALRGVADVPRAAIWADDVWISGHLAAQGLPVRTCPDARAAVVPLARPAGLQDCTARAKANASAAEAVHQAYGIWPPR